MAVKKIASSAKPGVKKAKIVKKEVETERKPSIDRISKKIGWINRNIWLAEQISYNDVSEPLGTLDEEVAIGLLDDLAAKAGRIRDPTGWLKGAAAKGGLGNGGGKRTSPGEDGEGEKRQGLRMLSCTVGWMNKYDELQSEIMFNKVAGPLLSLGDKAAGKLLKECSEKKETIRDPTGWLISAAMRQGAGMTGGKGGYGGSGRGGFGGGGGKVSKTIGWLNNNMELESPIVYNEVAQALATLGEGPACKLLHEFGEQAYEVRDPTRWILAAARRKVY